jgi:hypothetical protein
MASQEIWKAIPEFSDYEVSNMGRVRSNYGRYEIGKILKSSYVGEGYLRVVLTKNNEHFAFLVHRIVGKTFLENPENLPDIDHINQKKDDNRLENLRWTSKSDNNRNRPLYFMGTNSGEPFISYDAKLKSYRFQKTINQKKYSKRFPCLEEAVAYRDFMLPS